MHSGSFVTFSLLTQTQYQRPAETRDRSIRREKELEQSFVRSQVTQHHHAKRTPLAHTLKQRSRQKDTAATDRSLSEGRPPVLLVEPSSPYQTLLERNAIQFYFSQNILFLRRNHGEDGSLFWNTTAPQLAWWYPSVRYALVALSLGTQALVNNVAERLAWNTVSRETLEHQNMAIGDLINSSYSPFVAAVVAVIFRAVCLIMGDADGAYRHSRAASRLGQEISYGRQADSTMIADYVQSVFESDFDLLESVKSNTGDAQRLCPITMLSNAGITAAPSLDSPRCQTCDDDQESASARRLCDSNERERQYFESLVELAIARRKIRDMYDKLRASRYDSGMAQGFSTPTDVAQVVAFVSLMLENIEWVHEQWTSPPYLVRYLSPGLAQRLLGLQTILDNSEAWPQSSLRAATEGASHAPFIVTLDELAARLGMAKAASRSAMETSELVTTIKTTEFEELAYRLVYQAHVLLSTAAGTEPYLRRDILEMIVTGWQGNRVMV